MYFTSSMSVRLMTFLSHMVIINHLSEEEKQVEKEVEEEKERKIM